MIHCRINKLLEITWNELIYELNWIDLIYLKFFKLKLREHIEMAFDFHLELMLLNLVVSRQN